MKDLLRAGCELLADNKDEIHKKFAWDMELMSVAGSVIFTSAGKVADIERMKECKSILKKRESVFSNFRGNMEIPVISKMALTKDPEEYLTRLNVIYDKLSKGKIFGSEHIALTALAICDENMWEDVDLIVERTKELMKRMAAVHPMLTSAEDTTFAALLAMTNKSIDQIVDETEYCYNAMKKKFTFHNNSVQSLSHVLALCPGEPERKCAKVSAIYDALLVKGIKYGLDYELASLGALVNVDMTPEEIASEIAEAAAYLKTRKGFGDWGMGSKTRVMFAALMAVQAYAPNSMAMDASVLGSSLAMVIAEEVCYMVIMTSVATSSTN